MPLAILQMSDTPQIEQTAQMLRVAGYDVKYCGDNLRSNLISAGCDTVLSVQSMVERGYDLLDPAISAAKPSEMDKCDLFVEIKIRNVSKVIHRWPKLQGKIAYWRVNGAQPEICPKGGDEVNLPCPIITACLWYGTPRYRTGKAEQAQSADEHLASRSVSEQEWRDYAASIKYHDPDSNAYVFWPSYPRQAEYDTIDRSQLTEYNPPFCVCYNVKAWGYGDIIDRCRENLGVRFFGNDDMAGEIRHSEIPRVVSDGKALVHMKSVDCPGWALYEAILGGCPVITGRLLNSRMLAYDLLEHNVTCLEFGVPASLEYGRGDVDLEKCYFDIERALQLLSDPVENRRIGEAGRKRLNDLMWNVNNQEHVDSFRAFCKRHFG